MVEVRGSFRSFGEWDHWRRELGDFSNSRREIREDVKQRGFAEPFGGQRRRPFEIVVREDDLHESLSSAGLNSRKRALLVQLELELRSRNIRNPASLRLLGTEGQTRIAMILRGLFPFHLAVEANAATDAGLFPVPALDMTRCGLPDSTFDIFISSETFRKPEELEASVDEIIRILKPGGLALLYLPFLTTVLPAESGDAIPAGWDLLEKFRSSGCSDSYFSTIASSHFGIASEGKPGPFILTVQKSGEQPVLRATPPVLIAKAPLPEKLCTMLALPRSGTTLLTSMFAVHSEVVASYEPWNSKVLKTDNPSDSNIRVLATREKLPSLAGKILFVKETAANPDYIRAIRRLHEQAPYPIERHAIFLLRDPDHTLLSEVERRNEWWGDKVSLGSEFIVNWSRGRGRAIEQILDFVRSAGGVIVAFEEVAARPEAIMRELADRIGFCFEREQVDYEKHMGKLNVRGDLNVSRNPERIDLSRALTRTEKIDQLQAMISETPAADWFEACRALHAHVSARGGITSISDIPSKLIASLSNAIS
jgi:hypothetical protein